MAATNSKKTLVKMPNKVCCVPYCQSRLLNEDGTSTGIRFFAFCSEPGLAEQWKIAIFHTEPERKRFSETSLAKICEKHFRSEDVKVSACGTRLRLVPRAFPVYFPDRESSSSVQKGSHKDVAPRRRIRSLSSFEDKDMHHSSTEPDVIAFQRKRNVNRSKSSSSDVSDGTPLKRTQSRDLKNPTSSSSPLKGKQVLSKASMAKIEETLAMETVPLATYKKLIARNHDAISTPNFLINQSLPQDSLLLENVTSSSLSESKVIIGEGPECQSLLPVIDGTNVRSADDLVALDGKQDSLCKPGDELKVESAMLSDILSMDFDNDASTPQESGNETDSSIPTALGRKCTSKTDGSSKAKKKKGIRKGSVSGGAGLKQKLMFKCTNFIKEDHKQPIFGVQFFQPPYDAEEDPLLFGAVGSNRISIYRCGEDCGRVNLYQSYVDSDTEECFYTCTWTQSPQTGHPLFCYGGAKGILHVLDPVLRQCVASLQGHGSAINELKTHPLEGDLILSTSKDHTSRLWNISTEVCVAIFGGVNGHRDEVLSVDFDILATRIVSCGMDHSVKFWSLETDKLRKIIEESRRYNPEKTCQAFQTLVVHYPEFTTREVHRNYVDCCAWLGNFVLSKSCDNQVVLWQPKQSLDKIMKGGCSSDVGVFVLHKFDITMCDIWFMRFAVDYNQTLLAIGNQVGKIYVYDLDVDHPSSTKPAILSYGRCNSAVRQITFNKSARILLAVCDDGTIWRWDKLA